MKLNKSGKISFSILTIVNVILIALLIKFFWPASILLGVLYVGFIIFVNVIDSKSIKIVEENNKFVENYAKEHNLKIKYITPKEYNDLIKDKGGLSFEDKTIINKKDVKFI